ncbi:MULTISPECIES: hypothetical protein [Aliagarivorans]|uniref:hypothetical protein n=1 Tax=Aliagarivorans TaxID=882379 RepID=UPI0012FB3AAB|nr:MULTISPECIES: hypothetical protein [Aliagarivorans]
MKTSVIVTAISLTLASLHANALVSCSGIPRFVYVGYHGPSPAESSYGVMLSTGNGVLHLGPTSGTLATARYSMMLAAQQAQSSVTIEYFNLSAPDDCDTAVELKEVPTSVYSR